MKDDKRALKQNEILTKSEKLTSDLLKKALLYSIENAKEKKKYKNGE